MKRVLCATALLYGSVFAHECHYELDVELDLEQRYLSGTATIYLDSNSSSSVEFAPNSAEIVSIKNASLHITNRALNLKERNQNIPIELEFTHTFETQDGSAVLIDGWYPLLKHPCTYRVFVATQQRSVSVVESTKRSELLSGTLFEFDREIDRVSLISSPNYTVDRYTRSDGVELETFFSKEHKALSKSYLKKADYYFDMYKDIFGFIPYNKFSIVETPAPFGYSMSTMTLLGKQIIAKDFVLNNSLGHEIVHQWLGNSVGSTRPGNWSEGLTTYYADYLYAKMRSEDVAYRKDMLLKYDTFVNANNEISLIEFTQKNSEASEAIGYAKALFFFYMLEQKIGKKAFDDGVKTLLKEHQDRSVGYMKLREIFERTSSQNLLPFFKTWVYTKGAFGLDIKELKLAYEDGSYVVKFKTVGSSKVDLLPVKLCKHNKCITKELNLSEELHALRVPFAPTKMIIDDEYKIFRKLQPQEVRASIARTVQKSTLVVVDKRDRKKFAKTLEYFANIRYSDQISYKEIASSNLLLLGINNSLAKQLSLEFVMEGDSKIEVYKNPLNERKSIAIFDTNKELSLSIFYRLKHMGKYSLVTFKDRVAIKKEIKHAQMGVVYSIDSGSDVLEPKMGGLDEILDDVTKTQVVYVGENHTSFADHINQLEIIKHMYSKDQKISIGMEMFQQPFQRYLDEYISGSIDEKQMLIKTEYFKRWQYDYNLYRPIMLFAKENNISVIALNIDRNITKNIYKSGLDSLSIDQKKSMPDSIVFTNPHYKDELVKIFASHPNMAFKGVDDFYNAQLVWDEAMAQRVAQHLSDNPDSKMVVMAGNGHLMFGYGIPDRASRRGVKDYKILLNNIAPKPSIADYILYPAALSGKSAPKLGVILDTHGGSLKVTKVIDGAAKKAGIKKGDTIVKVNKMDVTKLSDLKEELYFVNKEANVSVKRADRELNFRVEW